MSIHSFLEQSRRNLAWRTCPTTTTSTSFNAPVSASTAAEAAPAARVLQYA